MWEDRQFLGILISTAGTRNLSPQTAPGIILLSRHRKVLWNQLERGEGYTTLGQNSSSLYHLVSQKLQASLTFGLMNVSCILNLGWTIFTQWGKLWKFSGYAVSSYHYWKAIFAKSIKRCVRIIHSDGYWFDPGSFSTLQSGVIPVNGAKLVQFVQSVTFVWAAIPLLHERFDPVRKSYNRCKGRLAVRRVTRPEIRTFGFGWSNEHMKALYEVRDMLCENFNFVTQRPRISTVHPQRHKRSFLLINSEPTSQSIIWQI